MKLILNFEDIEENKRGVAFFELKEYLDKTEIKYMVDLSTQEATVERSLLQFNFSNRMSDSEKFSLIESLKEELEKT